MFPEALWVNVAPKVDGRAPCPRLLIIIVVDSFIFSRFSSCFQDYGKMRCICLVFSQVTNTDSMKEFLQHAPGLVICENASFQTISTSDYSWDNVVVWGLPKSECLRLLNLPKNTQNDSFLFPSIFLFMFNFSFACSSRRLAVGFPKVRHRDRCCL